MSKNNLFYLSRYDILVLNQLMDEYMKFDHKDNLFLNDLQKRLKTWKNEQKKD